MTRRRRIIRRHPAWHPARVAPASDDDGGEAGEGFEVGGLERRTPLPVGRYWIDIPASKQAEFDGYLAGNQRIMVETTEGDGDAGTFYIFRVLQAVPWFAVNFGFPNTAGPEVKSRADTTQAPDLPKDATDQIEDALHSAGGFAELVMGLALVGGAVFLASKFIDRKKG